METESTEEQNLENNQSRPSDLQPEKVDNVKANKAKSDRMTLIQGMVISPWVSLGAILLAAFLVYPAYQGFNSGRKIQRLREELGSSNQSLSLSKSLISKLETDLYRVGLQGQGRVGEHPVAGLGLLISPILSLEHKKSGLPDLIHIDFRNKEESVLAFDLTPFHFEELQVSITQEKNLVWIQTISVPPKTLFGENLVTFVLTREALSAGEYKIKMDGNPSREIKRVGEFDLTIER